MADFTAEDALEEDDVQAIVPREWGYRGFYVATLRGQTIQRIAWEGPVASGAPLSASGGEIAAAVADRIELVPRGGGEARSLDLRWLDASPAGDRVLAAAPDGSLHLIHLGS